MTTTPAPTHASAVLGMVEFARNVSQDNDADCNGWASAARAALEAWEQRPRLRFELTALLYGHLCAHEERLRPGSLTGPDGRSNRKRSGE